MIKRWWERHPGRLEFEMKALADLGAPFEMDKNFFERGVVVLKGYFPVGSERVYLEITYPDHYPYFRFHVAAPELNLRYHLHPFQKTLCLLQMSTNEWHCEDYAASLLSTQLPEIYQANKLVTRGEVLEHESRVGYEIETREPEPVDRFMTFHPLYCVIIDSSWKPSGTNGALVIGFNASTEHEITSGAVLSVTDKSGNVLFNADPALARLYPARFKGRWQRVPGPIISNDAKEHLKYLSKINTAVATPLPQSMRNIKTDIPKDRDVRMDVIASVYEDETSHRDKDGTLSWAFIARWFLTFKDKQIAKKQNRVMHFFIKTERAGKGDMTSRIPELKGLDEKKISLFGLGCLGSQCAIEFAKAGIGELRILDYDEVSAGNAVRWIMGLSAIHKQKSAAVKELIEKNYPYTKVYAFLNSRIGDIFRPDLAPPGALSQNDVMDQMLQGTDLIVDATAEQGVQDFLAAMAREKGIPYIFVSASHGTRGGMVARFKPGEREGCCQCLRHHIMDKTIPVPNEDKTVAGQVIPAGCGEPTFTGNNFDAIHISLATVRTAISTILEGVPGGYPPTPWDVEVINLRDPEGNRIPPESLIYMNGRHQACQNHK